MVAEIARSGSRGFQFETKGFVISGSTVSQSFSRTHSASMLFDSRVVSALTGDCEELVILLSDLQKSERSHMGGRQSV
jgi:hypothetical protein